MTRKSIQRNIKALEGTLRANRNRLTPTTKQKVRDVIELYEDRKIAQVSTASKMINELVTATTKKDKERARTNYEKLMESHESKKPLGERMEASKKENTEKRKRTAQRTYSLEVMFFTYGDEKKNKMKPSFRDSSGKPLYPFKTEPIVANVKTTKDIEEEVRKRIIKKDDQTKFFKMVRLLRQDEDVNGLIEMFLSYGFDALKIYSATVVDGKGEGYDDSPESRMLRKYDPKKRKLRNSDNIGIYHRFIETELDPEYETFAEAIRVKHYVKHECWINTLTDFYKDSLMGEKRKQQMTRETVLNLIGTTEDEFKKVGASIEDMSKVFREYRITARIYDYMENLIFSYDPPKRDHNYKTFYALVKNDHIYTINTDLKKLRGLMAVEREHDINVKAPSDYHINERDAPVECRMINSIDDINKHTEHDEYTMIYRRNNLAELYYQSKQAGYEPYIKFTAGVVSELNFRFKVKVSKKQYKTISYKVKTQNLIKDSMDGSITVEAEQTYNNMSRAMYDFNQALFNPLHKSYYNESDMEVFKQCHTIAPCGRIPQIHYNRDLETDIKTYYLFREHCVEIDRRKAYTWAYNQIVEVPVFCEFDIWKPYDKHDFNDLTLYLVRAVEEAKMFFNKPYLLMYGMFLKHFRGKCEILYYKCPSHTHKVNYKSITEKLWDTTISHKQMEDNRVKKLIANVNIGLLEKGTNKAQKSLVFDTLSEALYHQTIHGGRINKISGHYEELDGEEGFETVEKETDAKYYTLTVSDTANLTNGFKYIKELLLQIHNFRMYEDYYKLVEAGVQVNYVKTDAFLIKTTDLKKARKLLNFSKEIGGWRVEKRKLFVAPTDDYEMKPNELVEIPTYENEGVMVEDEWDTQEIAKQILTKNGCMIKGDVAGTGKSYIGKYFKKLGYNVLFVVPTNFLGQQCDCESTTANKFFSISMEENEKLPVYDHSRFDVIVFDEIYCNDFGIYRRINKFIKEHINSKIIIATGDTNQLPPIKPFSNTKPFEEYANECISIMFKYEIYLYECKRLKTIEDKTKLFNIKYDLLSTKKPFEEIIDKYFKWEDDIRVCNHNIAYENRTCKIISNHMRKLLNKQEEFEIGDVMICKTYLKVGGCVFNVNIRYKIIKIDGNVLTLQNVKTMEVLTIVRDKLRTNFIYSYCFTAHSVQGSSIDDEIVIYDWNKHYVSRQWVYVAVTRARDLNKVSFYKYT